MRIRTINHTGKTRIVKYIEGKWTDLELETFKVISKKLKLTMLDLNGLVALNYNFQPHYNYW